MDVVAEMVANVWKVVVQQGDTVGAPFGSLAWMCTMVAPASLARRTSFAYSSGVYGMPAHCCLFATAPETAQVMMQGSSSLTSLS